MVTRQDKTRQDKNPKRLVERERLAACSLKIGDCSPLECGVLIKRLASGYFYCYGYILVEIPHFISIYQITHSSSIA